MPSMRRTIPGKQKLNGKTKHGRLKNTKLQRVRKGKASDQSRKRSRRERALQDLLPLDQPEATSCVADGFLFAMRTNKTKPTWRHATWNSADYMVLTIADPQKKLPVFKPGKWTINAQRRIALYGHDAKSMKNFTSHFDCDKQCKSLDRAWFGEVRFPVEKDVCEIQSAQPQDRVLDPAELDLEPDKMSQNCAFSDLKCEILHMRY